MVGLEHTRDTPAKMTDRCGASGSSEQEGEFKDTQSYGVFDEEKQDALNLRRIDQKTKKNPEW